MENEKIIMTKDEFLDKVQNCVDDISISIKTYENTDYAEGNVFAYSEEWDRMYEPMELRDRLSIEIGREIAKIIRIDGKYELTICKDETLVKKYRDMARYKVCTDKEYNNLVAEAANKLCLTRRETDDLLGGYGMF